MAHAAQVGVLAAMAELDEGLGEGFLGPAFGVGLGGVEEEAVVGGEDVGEQSG